MKELISKVVNKVFISQYDEILVFETDSGIFQYRTSAECCSSTWFDSLTGFDSLIGAKILSVTKIEMEEISSERDKHYGIKILTEKGHVDIVFRNSSNGFYGGSIVFVDDNLYNYSDYKQITDDWEA